ncbi:MAG: hypothetical protein IJL52_05865 [Clostridia bacterium]|nr:hypothetical protein [Clostridia bacterium]
MKRMKKLVSLLLAVVMLLLLASCGKDDEKPTADPSAPTAAAPQDTALFASLGASYEVELPVFGLTKWSATYGSEITYSDFSADAEGRIVKSVMHVDGESYDLDWTYDNQGRFSRADLAYVYDENNNIVKIDKKEYLYDEHGLIVEEKFDGETDTLYQYDLDDAGRVVNAEVTDADNRSKTVYEYTYNDLGLPVTYTESIYGVAMDEDIDTLSEIYNVDVLINPLGFLVKQERHRTYDSMDRQNDDYDTTADYEIVGTYSVKSSEDSRFMPGDAFVGFDENSKLPKPDSVRSDISFVEKTGDGYRFRLGEYSSDPISVFHMFIHAFGVQNNRFPMIMMPTRSFCAESNECFYSYVGVLKLLGYQVALTADGRADVTDASGLPVATITKAADHGRYVLDIAFPSSGGSPSETPDTASVSPSATGAVTSSETYASIQDAVGEYFYSFNPVLEYDAEQNNVIVRITASDGTVENINTNWSSIQSSWTSLRSMSESITKDWQSAFEKEGYDVNCTLIMLSDVNPSNTILLVVNGEVAYDLADEV